MSGDLTEQQLDALAGIRGAMTAEGATTAGADVMVGLANLLFTMSNDLAAIRAEIASIARNRPRCQRELPTAIDWKAVERHRIQRGIAAGMADIRGLQS